jgi:hypothetical protein
LPLLFSEEALSRPPEGVDLSNRKEKIWTDYCVNQQFKRKDFIDTMYAIA